MSVYKTVSNYFYEVLDFLQDKAKQYKSLPEYFKIISPEMKKELFGL